LLLIIDKIKQTMTVKDNKTYVKTKDKEVKFAFRLICYENLLGVAIDQIRGEASIPLTGYYYWPRSDAWSQILIELESKNWISSKEKVFLMDKTAEILNAFLDHQFGMSEKEEAKMNMIVELATDCQIRMVDTRDYY